MTANNAGIFFLLIIDLMVNIRLIKILASPRYAWLSLIAQILSYSLYAHGCCFLPRPIGLRGHCFQVMSYSMTC